MAPNLSNEAIATIIFGVLATLLAIITLVLPCCVFLYLPTIGQAFGNPALSGRYLTNLFPRASNTILRRQRLADLEANLFNLAATSGGRLDIIPTSRQGGEPRSESMSTHMDDATTSTAYTTTSAVANL